MAVEFEIIGVIALGVSCVGIVTFVQLRKFKSKMNDSMENVYAAVQQKTRERTMNDIPLNNIPMARKVVPAAPIVQPVQEVTKQYDAFELDKDMVLQVFKENEEYTRKMNQNLEVLRNQLKL